MAPTCRNRYVIYYGWLIAEPDGSPNVAAHQIAAARPCLLLAHHFTFEPRYPNLSRPVMALLQAAGVRVMAYTTTSYAARDPARVAEEAQAALDAGADGIFFDEVYNFLDDAHTGYYRGLADLVRQQGKTVIMNTGIAQTGEAIMAVTDILMVEHQWLALARTTPWHRRYPAERFMGNSSNEPGARACLGHRIGPRRAVRDTREAWAHGIGWHYSTDRYIHLPAWFGRYTGALTR